MSETVSERSLPRVRFDHNDARQTGPDPYALYRQMRAACPVGYSEEYGGFTYFMAQKEIQEIARRPEVFSSFPNSIPPVPVENPMIPLMTDPPAHQGYRQVLAAAFSSRRLNAALEESVREYARELTENLAGQAETDLIETYCSLIPVFALSRLLDIPPALLPTFQGLVARAVHETDKPDSQAAFGELVGLVQQLVVERAQDPREDDLISVVVTSSIEGRPMSVEEAIGICVTLIVAGLDTTQHALANFIALLSQRPDLRSRLIADPTLMPTAIEELLRYVGPVQQTGRTVKSGCVVDGVALEAGDAVLLMWAAANRDPNEFESAEEVHLDRAPNRHLAFGTGIHRCLGSHMARIELRIGLDQFLRTFPDYEVTESLDDPAKWATGIVRGPKRLTTRLNGPST